MCVCMHVCACMHTYQHIMQMGVMCVCCMSFTHCTQFLFIIFFIIHISLKNNYTTNLSSPFKCNLVAPGNTGQDADLQESTNDEEWQEGYDEKRELPTVDEGDDEASADVGQVHYGQSQSYPCRLKHTANKNNYQSTESQESIW